MASVLPILPPLLGLILAVACLIVGRRRPALALVALGGESALLAVGLAIFAHADGGTILIHALGGWGMPLGIVFVADRVSAIFLVAMLVVAAGAVVYALVDHETVERSQVLSLLFLLQTGLCGTVLTGDLFDFYVFFELMGLASYGLVAYRRKEPQLEAGLKFAALSLIASTLLLMGVGAIYAQTGQLGLAQLRELSLEVRAPSLYLFSVALVLTGLSLKAAILPLHFWLPDAHAIAPTAVSVLLSGAVVKVGAYGILRLLGANAPWVWEAIGSVLLPLAALTAVAGALMALAQRDLKRLLAYSTASQMGYVLVAVALGGAAGVAAALIHAVVHALTKSTLFLFAGTAMDATSERRWDQMGGLLSYSPLLATASLIGALSLAGIPPLAGFAGKIALFSALIDAGESPALGCLVAATATMLVVVVRFWLAIFGGDARAEPLISRSRVLLTAAFSALVVGVGILSGPLFDSAENAAIQLLDGADYRRALIGESP